jgi:uncharacterized membrane protein YgcG
VVWHPAVCLLAFLLLLFPHGRLPSRRWRPFAWLTVAVYLSLSLSAALSPGAVQLCYPRVTPPVHLPVAGVADVVFGALLLGQLLLLAVCLGSLLLRLRRASGEERQQVKWLVYMVATVVVVFVVSTLMIGAGVLFPLFGLIPESVAVAVFKYRLYDIDRLINRTLVYGLLTALLIGVYAGLVFLLGVVLDPATGDSALAVAASTLAAAASASTSTSTPCRPSCWAWSTRRSSRPRRRCGCGAAEPATLPSTQEGARERRSGAAIRAHRGAGAAGGRGPAAGQGGAGPAGQGGAAGARQPGAGPGAG